ncbi:MAG: DNA mismatch endonuclease Vsr, partial [Planctomycetaceae bacterium]|nr:DNA mismatch endonuclease Vsr [Planctomycetaceae bacterium]
MGTSMTDVHSPKQRSYNMSRIRDRDTKPEMVVRSIVHRMGYRFRLQRRDLPGKPDLVLPRHHKVIFVHGCFWHCHRCR